VEATVGGILAFITVPALKFVISTRDTLLTVLGIKTGIHVPGLRPVINKRLLSQRAWMIDYE